jgi:hypothetical protein
LLPFDSTQILYNKSLVTDIEESTGPNEFLFAQAHHMIPHQENGLFQENLDLWPYQWWHERRKYPSLLFIGLEEPLRAGAQVVVESHSTLYLERKFSDPDFLQWSPILIDECLTQDTCTRLSIVLDHISDIQGISYYDAMAYLILLHIFHIDTQRACQGEKSILFTDRADQYNDFDTVQVTKADGLFPGYKSRPAAWSIYQLVEFWCACGGKFAKGFAAERHKRWYYRIVPPVQISLEELQEIYKQREGLGETYEPIKAKLSIDPGDISLVEGMLAYYHESIKRGMEIPTDFPYPTEEKSFEHTVKYDSELNIFRKAGKYWSITYKGEQLHHIPHKLGFTYISLLLQSPYKHITPLDLYQLAHRDLSSIGQNRDYTVDQERAFSTDEDPSGRHDSDDITSKEDIKEYREHIKDLEGGIAEAKANNDIGRYTKLKADRDAILEELERITGLGGRSRKFSNDHERKRVGITKAIQRALAELKNEHEPLAKHLETYIKKGNSFCYNPDPKTRIEWAF